MVLWGGPTENFGGPLVPLSREGIALTAKIVAFSQNGDEFYEERRFICRKAPRASATWNSLRSESTQGRHFGVLVNAALTIFLILLIAIKIRPLVAALIAIFSSSF